MPAPTLGLRSAAPEHPLARRAARDGATGARLRALCLGEARGTRVRGEGARAHLPRRSRAVQGIVRRAPLSQTLSPKPKAPPARSCSAKDRAGPEMPVVIRELGAGLGRLNWLRLGALRIISFVLFTARASQLVHQGQVHPRREHRERLLQVTALRRHRWLSWRSLTRTAAYYYDASQASPRRLSWHSSVSPHAPRAQSRIRTRSFKISAVAGWRPAVYPAPPKPGTSTVQTTRACA